MKKVIIYINCIIFGLFFSGCAVKSEIKKVSESKSHFENAFYTGQKDFYKSTEKIDGEKYRIFHQASTGFVKTNVLRESAIKRANNFCKNINSTYEVKKISEHTGQPPYVLGNFPKIEIIFTCKEKKNNIIVNENKYDNLTKLKKLYDDGVLNKEEFEIEKNKILNK